MRMTLDELIDALTALRDDRDNGSADVHLMSEDSVSYLGTVQFAPNGWDVELCVSEEGLSWQKV